MGLPLSRTAGEGSTIEFVAGYVSIREGQGGSREDNQQYEIEASM